MVALNLGLKRRPPPPHRAEQVESQAVDRRRIPLSWFWIEDTGRRKLRELMRVRSPFLLDLCVAFRDSLLPRAASSFCCDSARAFFVIFSADFNTLIGLSNVQCISILNYLSMDILSGSICTSALCLIPTPRPIFR
jgi:hypothetical protein